MSQLAAVAKMLYYPTPLELVELLVKHIKVTGDCRSWGTIFDPTCGEGLFVQALAGALQARDPVPRDSYHRRWRTYGIELDIARATEAVTRMDVVVNAGLEQTVIQGEADLLFINPPYDVVNGERIEHRFMRQALPCLRKDGVAIFVLPDHYVDEGSEVKRFKALLRKYAFGTLRVFRFPDPYYDAFQQHVIIGVKGTASSWQQQYGDYNLNVQGDLGEFDMTPDQADIFYGRRRRTTGYVALPPQVVLLHANNDSQQWETLKLTPSILSERPANFTHDDFKKLCQLLGNPDDQPAQFRPLMPISDLHAAAVVAAGYLDGVSIDGKVLRGSTFKRMIERKGFKDGIETKIEAEISITEVAILNKVTGDLEIINSEDHEERFNAFILDNIKLLVAKIKELYPAIFTEDDFARWEVGLTQVKAPRALHGHTNGMFVPQRRMSAAMLTYWQKLGKIGIIVGEMSSGKTIQSLAATAVWAEQQRSRKIVVVLPAKDDLGDKWRGETLTALRLMGVKATFVGAAAKKRKNALLPYEEVHKAMESPDFEVLIMKDTTAKLSSGWRLVVGSRLRHGWAYDNGLPEREMAERYANIREIPLDRVRLRPNGLWNVLCTHRALSCTSCGALLNDVQEWELNPGEQQNCPVCGDALWTCVPRDTPNKYGSACGAAAWATNMQAVLDQNPDGPAGKWVPDKGGTFKWQQLKKLSRADWANQLEAFRVPGRRGGGGYPIARYLREHYKEQFALIIDEAHRMNGSDTAIGYAAADLMTACKVGVIMTGTIFNGMASSLFYLLYRSQPSFRKLFEYNDVQRFVNQYGLMQTITQWYPCSTSVSASGYREIVGKPDERPGVSPGMVIPLLQCAAFIKLSDLGFPMPPYKESTLYVDPDRQLLSVYNDFVSKTGSAAAAAAKKNDYGPRGEHLMARWGILDVPMSSDVVAGVKWIKPPLPPDGLFNKERALLRILMREKPLKRKVLSFVSQINRRDPTPRLLEVLRQYGLKGAALYSENHQRRAFIEHQLAEGADVIFCSPGIVDIGVDLEMFQTLIWYGLEYNALTVAQANRRLWRLTQEGAVEIIFLAYNLTPQAEGFDRVASRLSAMQALQGDYRAGLALLRGERDFLSELQEAVDISWQGRRFESTYKLSDFPPLKVFELPTLPPPEEMLWTPTETAYGQTAFPW